MKIVLACCMSGANIRGSTSYFPRCLSVEGAPKSSPGSPHQARTNSKFAELAYREFAASLALSVCVGAKSVNGAAVTGQTTQAQEAGHRWPTLVTSQHNPTHLDAVPGRCGAAV